MKHDILPFTYHEREGDRYKFCKWFEDFGAFKEDEENIVLIVTNKGVFAGAKNTPLLVLGGVCAAAARVMTELSYSGFDKLLVEDAANELLKKGGPPWMTGEMALATLGTFTLGGVR